MIDCATNFVRVCGESFKTNSCLDEHRAELSTGKLLVSDLTGLEIILVRPYDILRVQKPSGAAWIQENIQHTRRKFSMASGHGSFA